ncbi:MAG: amidohydrolase/deacetylase family metallohydrolase [Candidatus Bathyarchaeia archaeon]
MYDLVIKGGTVVDPSQRLHERSDIAVLRGEVEALEADISADQGRRVVEAEGCVVTPGLIDLHVHVYPGVSHFGVNPDVHCLARGITTVVDAGSSGADTFDGLRRYVIDVSATRVYAFLNISSMGMVSPQVGELEDIRFASVERAIEVCERNRDVIQGVKVRLSQAIVGKNGLLPLQLAKRVSEAVRMPLMVHVGATPEPLEQILVELRKGDLMTHCFHGGQYGILDEQGSILQEARDAVARGVIFDVGHGKGSFSFDVAEKALAQGMVPGTISSDLHRYNVFGPVYDLATTMSKFLLLGLSLDEVVAKAASTPASLLGMSDKIGTLRKGAIADISIFYLEEGKFRFDDTMGKTKYGRQRLSPACVIKGGKPFTSSLPIST